MNIKYIENPSQTFRDKNGELIKVGFKIKTNIDDQFLDSIIREEEGVLGLYFKSSDIFIRLDNMLERFFDTVEIIERK